MTRHVGLLGGSFNPAHRGHRQVTLAAIRALDLDEAWWLVSPGNPLKAGAPDMAPLAARLASARVMARRASIRATAVEARLGTRYTADTLRALVRRHPRTRFIWLMGEDNLAQFHRWRDWRGIARTVPIAVIARPGYGGVARRAPAMGWLRHGIRPSRQARCWFMWSLPALVLLRFRPDPTSATLIRAADPGWHLASRSPISPPIIASGVTLATPAPVPSAADPVAALHGLVLASLDDDQAVDTITIPLAGKSSIADHMVIASGRSTRQVASMAAKLVEKIKAETGRPARVEGLPTADWVLIDAGDVIVHLFRPEVRSFYNLEKMWAFGDAPTAGSA